LLLESTKILTNRALPICTPGNRPLGGGYLRAWYGAKPQSADRHVWLPRTQPAQISRRLDARRSWFAGSRMP